jgi:DNA-binding transcriptional ArsR family regulator
MVGPGSSETSKSMSRRTRNPAATRRNYAPIFAALGDETRLAIVAKLSEGRPRSIAKLTQGTRLTRQAVTKHLRVLEDARIVSRVKAGRESLFELDPTPIKQVREYADVVSEHWDQALARLKAFVEE